MKDFREQEYVAHTKCFSEAERYAAKGQYVAKPDKNKGAQKQEIWTECIEELALKPNLDATLRDVLERIAAQSNVPRKKPKFVNFLKSCMRFNEHRAEQVWKIIEEGLEEFKKRAAPPPRPNKSADETKPNGIESKETAEAATVKSNGVESVHENDSVTNDAQIVDVFAYALQQPDLDKTTRKILKKLQKCTDLPLNVQNPKRKKFTAFVQSKLELDAETAKQIWTIVSDAASVIKESKVNETNGVATTNGNAKKRKSVASDADDATSKKSKLENVVTAVATSGDHATTEFDWQKNIFGIFNKNSADNTLELATLQTKLIKRYVKHIGDDGNDGVTAAYVKKVKKQLKKIDGLSIENDVVILKV